MDVLEAILAKLKYFEKMKQSLLDQVNKARDEIRRAANPQTGIRLQPVSIRPAFAAGAEPVILGKSELGEKWGHNTSFIERRNGVLQSLDEIGIMSPFFSGRRGTRRGSFRLAR
jgi:hypothetical protein